MKLPKTITLPKLSGQPETLTTAQSLLFVGANGSGKTRLGSWIEIQSPENAKVHRISAQKSLSMPDSTTPASIEEAETNLRFGNAKHATNKVTFRWQGKPATTLLNDFDKLMVYLFSEEAEANAKFKASAKATTSRVDPPTTNLDKVKRVWEMILPHRELMIGGMRIQTRVRGGTNATYNSSEMSDGERVIFYLIGQCLAAPIDGIIVIDEPELHLHKSVQAPLWSEIEKLRDDCLFVYLTHDVDFASAQEGATRIWLKSFDGQSWDWEIVAQDQTLPDDLVLEVLGSRKPVIFVEGENGSYDVSLYREVLSNFLVLPRGSCSQVILAVKAFRANPQLHHLQICGIIDRDRRVPAEIAALETDSIFVLSVAEVENLFCTKELLAIVSRRLARDSDTDFGAVSSSIFRKLQAELENQVSLRTISEIKFRLNLLDDKAKGPAALTAALSTLANSIDVNTIFANFEQEFNSVLATRDYDRLLAIYNRKSLADQVSGALGLKSGELPQLVLRLLREDCRAEIVNAVKKYLGKLAPMVA